MVINKFKNNTNIIFSILVLLFTGFVIVKSLFADYQVVQGDVEKIDCYEDSKRKGVYSYHIKISDDKSFRNRLDVSCDAISKVNIGDHIELESEGHIFIQVTHNGINLFDRGLLSMKRSGVNLIFVLLFVLATFDLVYRLYLNKKKK